MAAITPLTGATRYLTIALPTPITPLMTFCTRPLLCTNTLTFSARLTTMSTMFWSMPWKNLNIGSSAIPNFCTPAIAFSLLLISAANLLKRESNIPSMAITGDTDNASKPPLRPITPPSVTLRPLSRLSNAPAKFFINPG